MTTGYEMDEFERRYARGEGEVFFRDKVPTPSWLFAFLLLGLVGFAAMTFATLPWPMALGFTVFGLLFATLGNLMNSGFRLVVSEGGIDAYMGLRRQRIRFDEIASMEQATVSWADYPLGKNIRRNRHGKAYTPGLDAFDGVKVHLARTGKHVFVPTASPQRFMDAVGRAAAAARGGSASEAGVVLGLEDEVGEERAQVEQATQVKG
jgi:hypothetical protein